MEQELLDQAKILGIEIEDTTTEEDLKKEIEAKKNSTKSDGDLDFYKSEARKAFEARDKAKKERLIIQEQLEEIKKGMKTPGVSDDDLKSLKKELADLRGFREQIEKERTEADLKNKSELERSEITFNNKVKELLTDFEEEKKKWSEDREKLANEGKSKEEVVKKLLKDSLENQIHRAASKLFAFQPEQIVRMLHDEFSYDETLGTHEYLVKNDKGKIIDNLSIEERVKQFLGEEVNKNLIRSKVNSDGTGHTQVATGDAKKSESKDFNSLSKDEKEEIEEKARRMNVTVDQYMIIHEKQIAARNRIQEGRKAQQK